ncbi:M15 family metallopeptidase domain-containing protein [Saccharothrix syringae]|uniref:M15 family peptidase n=1 Tax=Saccharothrix syringae TaxID=103733 RepID=A0A5Q0H6F0_SACSY|nr:hypothetical protein [Saccharothrix syringae]QFZ21485.1 hypothetical protein EKG83_32505 [Saccharothrix syringae]
MTGVSRRAVLAGGAGAVLWVGAGRAEAARWTGRRSANGWPVLDEVPVHRIEGSDVDVPLRGGDVAAVLLHVARRFHYEIDALRAGEVVGHTRDREVAAPYESNHLSGTAIAIRPRAYPVGVAGGLFPHELAVVHAVVAELDHAVAWGGDEGTPKEGHFHIAVPPNRLAAVAARVRAWDAAPGRGAGAVFAGPG